MHLRRFTLTNLVLAFAFAACSNDDGGAGDVPAFPDTMTDPGTTEPPPPGNEGVGAPEPPPSSAPTTPVTPGNGEVMNPDAPLDQPGEPVDMAGGPAPTEGEAEPFNCVLPELPDAESLTYLNEKLPDPFTFLEIFRSTAGQNDTGYLNSEYDGLVAASQSALEPHARMELLQKAERELLADMPILPLYIYVTPRLVQPWVGGYEPNLLDHQRHQYMYVLKH